MKEILLAGDTNRLVAELTFVSGATHMVRFVVVWGCVSNIGFFFGRFCLHVDGIKVGFSQIHDCQHHLFVLEDRQKCFGMELTLRLRLMMPRKYLIILIVPLLLSSAAEAQHPIIRSETKTSRSCSAFVAVMSEQMNECFKPRTVLDQVEAEEAFVVSIHIFTFRCHCREVYIIDGPSDRQ